MSGSCVSRTQGVIVSMSGVQPAVFHMETEMCLLDRSSSYALTREMYQHDIKVTNTDDTRQVSRISTAGCVVCRRL